MGAELPTLRKPRLTETKSLALRTEAGLELESGPQRQGCCGSCLAFCPGDPWRRPPRTHLSGLGAVRAGPVRRGTDRSEAERDPPAPKANWKERFLLAETSRFAGGARRDPQTDPRQIPDRRVTRRLAPLWPDRRTRVCDGCFVRARLRRGSPCCGLECEQTRGPRRVGRAWALRGRGGALRCQSHILVRRPDSLSPPAFWVFLP